METILHIDEILFSFINQELSNPFLDMIMPYWREKTTWIPLYIFILIIAIKKLKWKKFLLFVLLLAGTVGLADQVSSQWIKKSVQRIRPCNDTEVKDSVNLLIDCGSGYSFTSSHATNHFAVAFFIAFVLFANQKKWRILLFLWAASIALGQVYVGVHYPIDITFGALLGCFIGWIIYKLWLWSSSNFFDSPPIA